MACPASPSKAPLACLRHVGDDADCCSESTPVMTVMWARTPASSELLLLVCQEASWNVAGLLATWNQELCREALGFGPRSQPQTFYFVFDWLLGIV